MKKLPIYDFMTGQLVYSQDYCTGTIESKTDILPCQLTGAHFIAND